MNYPKLRKLLDAAKQLIPFITRIQYEVAQDMHKPPTTDRGRELGELHTELGTINVSLCKLATILDREINQEVKNGKPSNTPEGR